jgi:uncharacterized protein YaeQ
MATGATIYRADLSIADMDRNYYADHSLTIARHPSETEERLMVRLLAFALYAAEDLDFGRGLSTDDEPDLWRRDLTGLIELWVDVGLPEEKWLRKACGRARQVVVLAYGASKADQWWKRNEPDLRRLDNLMVLAVPTAAGAALAAMAGRSMRLNVTIQEAQIWLGSDSAETSLQLDVLKAAPVAT